MAFEKRRDSLNLRRLNKAKKEASKSEKRFKHATLILKGGALISTGYNHDSIHAERSAINKLWPSKIRNATLISIRITKTGFGKSHPCRECFALMLTNGIKNFIYWDGDDWRRENVK